MHRKQRKEATTAFPDHAGYLFSPGWGGNIRTVLQQNTSWAKKHQHDQTVSFFSAIALKELLKIILHRVVILNSRATLQNHNKTEKKTWLSNIQHPEPISLPKSIGTGQRVCCLTQENSLSYLRSTFSTGVQTCLDHWQSARTSSHYRSY